MVDAVALVGTTSAADVDALFAEESPISSIVGFSCCVCDECALVACSTPNKLLVDVVLVLLLLVNWNTEQYRCRFAVATTNLKMFNIFQLSLCFIYRVREV